MPKGGELTEGELREEPQWVRWVKKTNRKDVVQDRLLAVGIYRIFSIKRTKTGKKQIQRAGHILGLKEIFSDDIDKVRMDFGEFKIVVTGTSLGMELPKVLLNCFHKITFNYPEYAVPKLVLLPHGRNPPPIDPLEPGIAGGLIETYFAQCDFLSVAPSSEVITYLEDESNTDERQMKLDYIQGFSKNSEFSFNPSPLLASLRHNTYFTSLSCHDKSRKDIVPLIADVLLHNKTLTTIDLTGLEAEEGWTQVGDALRGNPSHQIMDLILSDNPINDKAAAALGSGLASPHGPGIRKYKMTNTKITAAGAGALIKGLSVKREYGNFREIDLSQNSLKGAGMSFSELVASMQSNQSKLQRILLAHTQVDLAPLVDGIRHTLYGVVEHLDFTGCRMDDHAAKLCTYFFEKTTSIKHVLMGSCGLSGHQIAAMLTAISSNGNISELTVDFSNNILDTKNECDIFCKAISESKNLYSLSLRELEFGKLGDENLSLVVKALSNNFCIREIDLSGNFKIKPKEKDNGLGALQLLATVLEKHTTITSLKIEGIGQNSVGRSISTLFPILGESSKLQKLDVRGHGFGDAGAKELFDILRWNKSLLSLKFDNNLITQAGWAFALRCLNANRTIQEIEYPKMDIARVVAKTSTFATHESVFSIFSKLSKFTANNSSGEFDERGPVPSKPSKEHAYQVRKASRMATMVISRMTSGSIPPLPVSYSSSSLSLSLSFDDGSDTDSNDSGSNLPSPTGRPPIPPRTNFSSPSLSSPLSSPPSKNFHSPLPPPILPPLPPPLSLPLSLPLSDFPSSPTLGPPPFPSPSSSLSLSLSSEPPLGEPPLPPPPF